MTDTRIGRLHVLTDVTLQSRYDHAALALRAARGGADVVQLRDKAPRTTRWWVETARVVRQALQGTGVKLVIDDRADVAAAAEADGVHLGRNDLDPGVARRLLGAQALIGGTANSYDEALRVAEQPVDYLGVGPVFGTASKLDPAPELGLVELGRIVRAIDKPVIAIGRITSRRIAEVLASGAYGVAVLSAVVSHADPEQAVRELAAELRRHTAPAEMERGR